MIEVVIADDHPQVRKGICALLSGADGIEVVGEATNGKEAVELATALAPDVVVMDISMPEMNGLEAMKALPAGARPPVLFLSMHGDESLVRRALEAGAAGYVLKRAAATELLEGIRSVYAGNHFLCRTLRPFAAS